MTNKITEENISIDLLQEQNPDKQLVYINTYIELGSCTALTPKQLFRGVLSKRSLNPNFKRVIDLALLCNDEETEYLLNEIIKERTRYHFSLVLYAIYILSKVYNYHSYEYDLIIQEKVTKEIETIELEEDVSIILEYMDKRLLFNGDVEELTKLRDNVNTPKAIKALALKYLLNVDEKSTCDYIKNNYNNIISQGYEVEFVGLLPIDNSGYIGGLKSFILNKGTRKAKAKIYSKTESSKEISQTNSIVVSRIEVRNYLEEIFLARKKINTFTKNSDIFGFQLFLDSEEIYSLKIANSIKDIISHANTLREIIDTKLNNSELKKHGYKYEEASKIVPNLSNEGMNKSLNAMLLYFHKNGISIDETIFGMRELRSALVSLVHEGNSMTVKLDDLKKIGVDVLFMESKYQEMLDVFIYKFYIFHKKILNSIQR